MTTTIIIHVTNAWFLCGYALTIAGGILIGYAISGNKTNR